VSVRRTVTALGLAAILCGACAVPGPKAAPPVTRGTLPATVAPTPTYTGRAEPIPAAVRDLMVGRSWRPGCPVGLDQLRLLTVTYWGFDGRVHGGNLVVHQAHAQAVVGVFGALFAARFPIERIQLVDDFGADDSASMAANNTSAFNCRPIDGQPGVWSEHSYGWAIDVNPVQNPWVRGIQVDPPAGVPYADRTRRAPGMIQPDDAVVGAFRFIGWTWGGTFRNAKDYQHFSATGR
jgi:poly-gamma-glutamate synthesis protein (capsule biosynthesis protein)